MDIEEVAITLFVDAKDLKRCMQGTNSSKLKKATTMKGRNVIQNGPKPRGFLNMHASRWLGR
jgi:hypothetical protein